jgi:hypothetical protein
VSSPTDILPCDCAVKGLYTPGSRWPVQQRIAAGTQTLTTYVSSSPQRHKPIGSYLFDNNEIFAEKSPNSRRPD